jgi:hypothetical protein
MPIWARPECGRRHGGPEEPALCDRVTAVDDDGDTLVYVAPITHSRRGPGTAVELPAGVKRRLGLDASASWVVTSELNRRIWPISGNSPDVFSWGYLPVELMEAVKLQIVAHQRARRLGVVDRSWDGRTAFSATSRRYAAHTTSHDGIDRDFHGRCVGSHW